VPQVVTCKALSLVCWRITGEASSIGVPLRFLSTKKIKGIMDKKKKLRRIVLYAANVQEAIKDMLTNEDSKFYMDLREEKDGDITPFLTGMCMAHLTVLQKLCGSTGNFLDAIHIENRLIVQYLMDYGKVADEKEDEQRSTTAHP